MRTHTPQRRPHPFRPWRSLSDAELRALTADAGAVREPEPEGVFGPAPESWRDDVELAADIAHHLPIQERAHGE